MNLTAKNLKIKKDKIFAVHTVEYKLITSVLLRQFQPLAQNLSFLKKNKIKRNKNIKTATLTY